MSTLSCREGRNIRHGLTARPKTASELSGRYTSVAANSRDDKELDLSEGLQDPWCRSGTDIEPRVTRTHKGDRNLTYQHQQTYRVVLERFLYTAFSVWLQFLFAFRPGSTP
jgi:hypothetical protein